jgi:uncharacterized repeat protein (TIGR03803 family)
MHSSILSRVLARSVVSALVLAAVVAHAQTFNETVLYNFAGTIDGSDPSGLILDGKGNLYGTTPNGGTAQSACGNSGCGNIFRVTPAGAESNIRNFLGQPNDGQEPVVGLIADKSGNGYGTTYLGGAHKAGTVFEITKAGQEGPIYSFAGSPDGSGPCSPLASDTAGNLYGVTSGGGTVGFGTVYKLTKSGGQWKESVLYNFTEFSYLNQPPNLVCAGLVVDSAGNLYGTTYENGANHLGMIFEISPTGQETNLYSFKGSSDGAFPMAGLVRDSAGNLYGTATAGGDVTSNTCGQIGCGVVFVLNSSHQETVLHTFEKSDGLMPEGTLLRDSQGNLFGPALNGGSGLGGVVFAVSARGQFSVLHNFSGPDGYQPQQGLIRDSKGNLYGTTVQGGTIGYGTVYKLSPTR